MNSSSSSGAPAESGWLKGGLFSLLLVSCTAAWRSFVSHGVPSTTPWQVEGVKRKGMLRAFLFPPDHPKAQPGGWIRNDFLLSFPLVLPRNSESSTAPLSPTAPVRSPFSALFWHKMGKGGSSPKGRHNHLFLLAEFFFRRGEKHTHQSSHDLII